MDPIIDKGYKDAMNNTVEQDFDMKPEPYPTLYTKGYNVGLKEIKRIEEWIKKFHVEAAYPLGINKDFLVRSNPLFEGGALKELQSIIKSKNRYEKEKRRYESSKGSYRDLELEPEGRKITIIDHVHERVARILAEMQRSDMLKLAKDAVEELDKIATDSLLELAKVSARARARARDEIDVAYTLRDISKTLGKRKAEFRKTRKSKSARKTQKSKTRKSKSARKMK
jgi:hypothetical protein